MGEPLFGQDSMTWKISRESVLLIGGPAALLMQLAHPSVAAGVAQHSNFQNDGFKRLRRTLDTMLTILFAPEEESRATAARVNGIHATVNGVTPAGERYDALDPELLLWVWSTLIDSAVRVYEACIGPLTQQEITDYYEESKQVADRFEIPPEYVPETLYAMRAWMTGQIDDGRVVVTDLARELAEPILRPLRFVPRPLMDASAFITASLLPPEIREGYGLRFGVPSQTLAKVGGRASRFVLPRLPMRVRTLPLARIGSR